MRGFKCFDGYLVISSYQDLLQFGTKLLRTSMQERRITEQFTFTDSNCYYFQTEDRCRKVLVEHTELQSKLNETHDDFDDMLKKYKALVQQVQQQPCLLNVLKAHAIRILCIVHRIICMHVFSIMV